VPVRVVAVIVLAGLAAACGRSSSGAIASTPPAASPIPSPTTAAAASPSVDPSAAGAATALPGDLPAGDVPIGRLIPAGTDPEGSWYGRTSDGDAIVVAWQRPGADPFRADRGFVVWRDAGDPPSWRPVFTATYPAARHPVLGITATIDDVTGDGSQDALLFAQTGGSGACGTYLVIDLLSATEVFRRSACDTTIDPSSDPVGLVVTEAVYTHGDPHCCPSATRTTVLQRDPAGGWATVSETTTPT
jgi:hypothetical protein